MIDCTVFTDVHARTCEAKSLEWSSLGEYIRTAPTRPSKSACPLIKLATFGDKTTVNGSLRHDINLMSVTGIEGDYDGGSVMPEKAIEMLERHQIRAMVYTTPSHTYASPRWRVLAPLSKPCSPNARLRYAEALNGALAGILAPETATLSQSFYFGRVNGSDFLVLDSYDNPDEGFCLDEIDDLDSLRQPFPVTQSTEKPDLGNDPAILALGERGMVTGANAAGGYFIRCPWEHEHTTESNQTATAFYPPHTHGFIGYGFKCQHSHCAARTGKDVLGWLGLLAPDGVERKYSTPPPMSEMVFSEEELANAKLTPRCIVQNHTYADVAQVVAPGGVGKTTVLLYEAIHIAIGRKLWDLEVENPGWTLFISAEDQRERLGARFREIMNTMELTPDERTIAIQNIRIWDIAGSNLKLIQADNGNMQLTGMADDIVSAYIDDPPAVVVFDPMVSFGVSEQAVNDNEQALITAARRIVRDLDCCVRFVHHTGKANARENTLDQYSGRGGSALSDGSRMTTVLQAWKEGTPGPSPPPGCTVTEDSTVTVMARAKLSYCKPQPIIWIRRTRFGFEHFRSPPPMSPEESRAAQADQLERFIRGELELNRYHTKHTLEACAGEIDLTRAEVRRALIELSAVSRRVCNVQLPAKERHGGRTTYLCPSDLAAEADSA